ncbi:hypothetical protein AGMMS49942_25370 [Spirochaetia bacterium]|nr:hypothetical protein AGMMS49942_25370 [Spirochaetia bacterium]
MKKWQFLLTAALALLLGGALALTGCDNGTTSNSDPTGTTVPTGTTGTTEDTGPTEEEMNAGDFVDGEEPTKFTVSSKAEFETAKAAIEETAGNYVLTITGTVDIGDIYITPAANTVVSLRGGGTSI